MVQTTAPEEEYIPAEQLKHETEPADVWYVPAVQLLHPLPVGDAPTRPSDPDSCQLPAGDAPADDAGGGSGVEVGGGAGVGDTAQTADVAAAFNDRDAALPISSPLSLKENEVSAEGVWAVAWDDED